LAAVGDVRVTLAMVFRVFLVPSTSIGIEARVALGTDALVSSSESPPLLAAFSGVDVVWLVLAILGLMVILLVPAYNRQWNCHCHCIARLRAYFAADQPMELQSPMMAAAVEPAPSNSPEPILAEAAWA
jgi:hypothetical protein